MLFSFFDGVMLDIYYGSLTLVDTGKLELRTASIQYI